ncbi:hypothetical protein FRC03_000597 [Tulasnella sp. 419]|nr:hypothetical protein FRC03_000597 [Tulasnella sp. 419]
MITHLNETSRGSGGSTPSLVLIKIMIMPFNTSTGTYSTSTSTAHRCDSHLPPQCLAFKHPNYHNNVIAIGAEAITLRTVNGMHEKTLLRQSAPLQPCQLYYPSSPFIGHD